MVAGRFIGYQFMAEPGACDYCIMLASRGAVYDSKDIAVASQHDHCNCVIIPVYDFDVFAKKAEAQAWAHYQATLDRKQAAKKNPSGEPKRGRPPKPLSAEYKKTSLHNTTEEEKSFLNGYSAKGGEYINAELRNKKPLEGLGSHDQEVVKNIDSALNRSPLPHDTVLYRGNSAGWVGAKSDSIEDLKARIGEPYDFAGYISTTANPNMPHLRKFGSIDYTIVAPTGTPAAYIAPISEFSTEEELLLGRGLTGRITEVSMGANGRPSVKLVLEKPSGG